VEPYQSDERSFWRPSAITAAAVIALIVVAGVILVVVESTGGHHSSRGAVPAVTTVPGGPTSTTSVPPTTTTGAGCTLPTGDQTVPEGTPQGVTWQIYESVALPQSPIYGPQHIDGDIARCYAHNPVGALIAATQIAARIELAPDVKPAKEQLVANAGQRAFIATQQKALNSGNGVDPGTYAQFAGFKYVTYTPAVAVIEVATKTPEAVLQASTLTVKWMDGDWKLELQPTGDTTPNVLPLSNLVGYSTWAGV
jgi:hypothetical protein